MNGLKFWKALAFLVFVGISLFSCSNEGEVFVEEAPTQADSLKIVSLNYFDFVFEDDVVALNESKTALRVKRDYLEKMEFVVAPANVVTVMRAKNELPYYLRVERVERMGEVMEVYGTEVTIEEVLPDTDIVLNTTPYYNPQPHARTISRANELGVDPGLMNEHGELHPTLILRTGEDMEPQALNSLNHSTAYVPGASRVGEEYLAFDVREQGTNADLSGYLSLKFQRFFNLTFAADSILSYSGSMNAELGAKVALKTSWFSLKKFETRFFGSYEVNSILGLNFGQAVTFGDKNYEPICSISSYYTTFFIGPIPVVIQMRSEVVRKVGGILKGALKLGIPIHLSHSFEKGVIYEDKKWDTISKTENKSRGMAYDKLTLQGSVYAKVEAGVYLKAGAYLYGSAGPYALLGPALMAELSAAANVNEDGFKFKAEASVGLVLAGAVGAEVKIWKWNLGDFNQPFEMARYDFFHEKWGFDVEYQEKPKVQFSNYVMAP
ncbi:MAG: hypothetical protein ACRC3Z_12805 [Phocaeicola sp.]